MGKPRIDVKIVNEGKMREVLKQMAPESNPRFWTEMLIDSAALAIDYAKTKRFIAGGRFRRWGAGSALGDAPARPGILTSRTGRFRDSITFSKATAREVTWGPKVRYAPRHEFVQPKRPVVAPTMEWLPSRAQANILAKYQQYVRRKL